jgi:Domain of unknown function (DUF4416)
MAQIKSAPPALFLAAIFSSQQSAIDWARNQIAEQWGTIGLISPCFEHSETSYYTQEMGAPIFKQFVVLEKLFDPAELAQRKLQSNQWEQQLAASGRYNCQRPVNIDPGYLTLGKLVLASAKDRAHRIYLRDGVYAEECLYYVGGWQSRPWTYPDYQRTDFQEFFSQARELLKQIQLN